MFSKLSSNLARRFTSTVRSRGQDYFSRRAVQILHGSADSVEARVWGSRNYSVSMEWADGDFASTCSCPYFEADGPCKHLWATVLEAQKRGYLSSVTDSVEPPKLLVVDQGEIESDLPRGMQRALKPKPPVSIRPSWRSRVANVASAGSSPLPAGLQWPTKREILYVIELQTSVAAGEAVLSIASRDRKADGTFTRPATPFVRRHQLSSLPNQQDREVLAALLGGSYYTSGSLEADYANIPTTISIRQPLAAVTIPQVARTGRCYLGSRALADSLTLLTWDEAGPWRFELQLRPLRDKPAKVNPGWFVTGVFRRGEQTINLSAPSLVTRGLLYHDGKVAPLVEEAGFEWIAHLRQTGSILAPAEDLDELLSTLLCAPSLPHLDVPEELRFEEVAVPASPRLKIRPSRYGAASASIAELSFDYEGRTVQSVDKARGFYESAGRRFIGRDPIAEKAAADFLLAIGVKLHGPTFYEPEPEWTVAATKLSRVTKALLDAGWHLDVGGKIFRRAASFQLGVSSGVDWFELHGTVDYGTTSAKLPRLLEALRRGESSVLLDDGSYGILPTDWMRRIGTLAGMGTATAEHIRFRPSQAGLLDALLAAQPEATFDKAFGRVRDELRQFRGVKAAAQPKGFKGQLRDYQRDGLGWMEFLRRFSFGGCLADDMGVGKTAQVLAMLDQRREERGAAKASGPSLVVVPRSLVFNWKQEAERFTPRLRVLDHTGISRTGSDLAAYDLVITTYGTLRRDAATLRNVAFDYLILDEAQMVKNSSTEAAKAVRLLRGAHRLALSGTPIENHLGELWSLFEFLNPGMLGAASVFKAANGGGRTIDEETRKMLAHALRPFILRRTKEQVARELPAKTEQTVYCEMEPVQRKLYNELRDHYRDALRNRIAKDGLAKSKIMVLEALLRLRQAACHPGLIDSNRIGEPSAKIEALHEQLNEVIEGGHKALVFSQFTSLLKIVRDRLDRQGVIYEYLDGKTTNRQQHVERFQNSADCKVFLISLKAGGLGLNLTAAEYVFLLDPWWNPAVEAQAVDRAHRIGQTKSVFAYRLIARDTVEEKVLELQKTKRALADAIIGEDNALIRNLRSEDLELLLS